MKDGRTHLALKAEHAVDMETGATVSVTVQPADRGDTKCLGETLKEVEEVIDDILEDEESASNLTIAMRPAAYEEHIFAATRTFVNGY